MSLVKMNSNFLSLALTYLVQQYYHIHVHAVIYILHQYSIL